MKKFLLIILLCLMAVGIQAQAIYINTTYVPATIMFRDGHEETYDKVQMPTKFQEKITIKLEDEGKRKISAEDILFITYWREKFPEDKHTIYCLIVHEKKDIFPEWGVPIMASDWCVVFRCYDSYGIDRKTGDLMFTITLDQSLAAIGKIGLTEWQPLLLQRLDRDYAETVGFIRTYNKNKEEVEEYDWGEGNKGLKLRAKLFEDNEEIYNKILDGTLQASDLQFIIDQMK